MSGPGALPEWVRIVAPLVLVGLILAGGFWMRSVERRARELERQQEEASGSSD